MHNWNTYIVLGVGGGLGGVVTLLHGTQDQCFEATNNIVLECGALKRNSLDPRLESLEPTCSFDTNQNRVVYHNVKRKRNFASLTR